MELKYTYDASGDHAPTYPERKPWLFPEKNNIASFNVDVLSKALKGEPVSPEEAIITALTSLTVAAALVPLVIAGGSAAYEEAKKKGWIK